MPCHHGHEQDCADELQPGCGWNSERTDSEGNRCPRRRDGPRDRRHGDTVPYAEPLQRTGGMESSCTMRQGEIHLAMEDGARRHSKSGHLAGPGFRANRGEWKGCRHKDGLGSGAEGGQRSDHGRHVSQRTDAHRPPQTTGRTNSGTGCGGIH